ncbi:MAG: hypothetical protein ACREA0_17685, partial [bacterium]
RSDAQVFSDVHVYYHGAGAETKYAGTMQIGFFRGAGESIKNQTNITVRKTESITNQSVTGIVTGCARRVCGQVRASRYGHRHREEPTDPRACSSRGEIGRP